MSRLAHFPRAIHPLSALLLATAPLQAQTSSSLWGNTGELWDPGTSRLRDFTNVGYMSGSVAIPDESDWPVGADVTNFGAIPNDGQDDSQAFIDAIAACPNNHAVYVPNGRYTILQQIVPGRDYFVLRGQDMYQTVLHFPKYLNEIYVQEVGYGNPAYDDGSNGTRHTGVPKGFFRVTGGTHRSIENLSFEFREQRKMGHWEHKGASAIYYGGDVEDSWVRNIYIKNGDNALMMGRSYRISFLNIIFDHYIGRPDIIGSSTTHRWVGHIGISMSNAQYCLFHNIDFRGNYFHEFDNINVPKNCVASNITGTDVSLHHHGQGANQNLYTNASVGTGPGISGLGTTQDSETHWRIFGNETLDAPTDPVNLSNNHVFVGYDSTQTGIIDATTWYEVIDPAVLEPQNIYLAQLAHPGINKPLPEGPPAPPPSQFTGDVIRMNPDEDSFTDDSDPDTVQNPSAKTYSVGDNMYFKFDLNGLSLSSIAKVRLRVSSTKFVNTPIELAVSSIDDDTWADDTLTYNGRPPAVAVLDTIEINEDSFAQILEFDVTPFVQAQWAADKVVSLVIEKTSGGGFLSGIRSSEMGLAPELIIEQVASSVPGAPSAPADVKSYSLIGNVQLDWPDNPESDVATYNVYRSTTPSALSFYVEPIATGLLTSDFVDIQDKHDGGWDIGMMRDDRPYYYRVTAVDAHGYESESSLEIVGTAKGYADDNLPPAFVTNPVVLPSATQYASYAGSLVTAATDPEGDPLYFSKVDGPEWLSVAHDGTLSGTPGLGDTGTFQCTVQVNSLGSGRDEAIVEITVDAGPPDAPLGLDIVPGDASVQLDWSHSSEGAPDFTFKLYRSLTAGGPFNEIASGLIASAYTDSGLSNGTTYHYAVTATNASGESPYSDEVFATPVAGLVLGTNFLGGVLDNINDWDAGLPIGQYGRIHTDGEIAPSSTIDYLIIQTAGTISNADFNGTKLDGGQWHLLGGTLATRGFSLVAGTTSFTVAGSGIADLGNNNKDVSVNAGTSFSVNGGTVTLGRHLRVNGGLFSVSGGTIIGDTDTIIGSNNLQANGVFNFNGGSTAAHLIDLQGANTAFNFGGSSPGSLTATGFAAPFGSNSSITFLPGSLMSLRVSGEDEWAAAKWAAGDLTYNSLGVAELGSWAEVTAPNGLGPGVRFEYDSATETLLLSDPDGDGDGIEDAWEVLNFGSRDAIDGSLDSDGDGVLDFFEYLYGSDPNDAASGGFSLGVGPATGGGDPVFAWETLEGFVLGEDYGIQVSTNLGSWDTLPVGHYSLQTTAVGGMTTSELTLTFDHGTEVFLRLVQP